jgi:aspartate carbamoyltransferase catalytic subunit
MPARRLLSIGDLSPADVDALLDAAAWYLPRVAAGELKLASLRGVSTLLMFFEPSTRTRVSFELAAKLLGSDTISVTSSGSSVEKGESVVDTAQTLSAMGFHVAVVRHRSADSVELFAQHFAGAVINGGAGRGEHPTQALLDAAVLKRAGMLEAGRHLAIVGDILHSRVARSNLALLTLRGVKVTLVAPPPLMPPAWHAEPPAGTAWETDLDRVLPEIDAVMMLRMQRERMGGGMQPPADEYSMLYGLDARRLNLLRPDAVIMHPGPVNRGVEVCEAVFADPRCRINEQVTMGVALRCALLCWACGRPLIPEGGGL